MGRYEDALADLTRAVEFGPKCGWTQYQIGLVEFALGRTDAAHERLSKAIDLEQRAVEEFPRDGWRALNIAVYLLASGEPDQAKRHVYETLEQTVATKDLQLAIQDLDELHAARGCDVADLVTLLRSRLPSD